MFSSVSLPVSQLLLASVGTKVSVTYAERIPHNLPIIVVSNHRSFLDASVLMVALNRSIRVACHHYMGQTPLIKEIAVDLLGCLPLDQPQQRQQQLFAQATNLLHSGQWVGLFPEGTQPMVKSTKPNQVGKFRRGFAHLAYRTDVPNLAVLPVAIASLDEENYSTIPLRWLSLFDPTEPLFDRPGLHPMVVYQRINVLIGQPFWLTPTRRESYQGKGSRKATLELTQYCHHQIVQLLKTVYA